MEKDVEQVLMAGFGGQGVLFLGKVVAEVGMHTGNNVSWIPSYGPEMRGGTANCSVVISKEAIASPIVNEPDTLVAMNKPSVTKFEPTLKAGGMMIYNSSLIDNKKFRDDIRVFAVPASEIAGELGNDKVANVVLVGAYARLAGVFSNEDVLNVLPKLIPASKKEMLEINLAAYKKGYEYAEGLN